MPNTPIPQLWPSPKSVEAQPGSLRVAGAGGPGAPLAFITEETDSYAGEVLAARLNAPVCSAGASGAVPIRLTIQPGAEIGRGLGPDQRPEAYRLTVGPQGIEVTGLESEGLLRGAATLLQLLHTDGEYLVAPWVTITDWPNFRYRCAGDWLLNCEINRWGYDWADGAEALEARMQRKLQMCFEYKINQVWFDGLGWDVHRFEGYAELMRRLNRYARRRGIKLVFAGYGGGYGTSYQTSELYRCGYQGQTFINRRPFPDGEEYLCCGLPDMPQSRRYGTCPSNGPLQEAKLEEMTRFVAAVEPGFMYIHDIDAGGLEESRQAWLMRCDECRRRWPSDEMADPDGQAGAMAGWFRKIRERLNQAGEGDDYDPATDLILLFTSPVYTNRAEPGQPDVWDREVEYFAALSACLGPMEGAVFGLREQFLQPSGDKRILQLRQALDAVGNGHGIHVISFGGGDNYNTDDLVNTSGALAHLFEGAQSVCLSNGGVHEEPVQLMNADYLWSGTAQGYVQEASNAEAVDAIFEAMSKGKHRPAEVFAPEGVLHQACLRLWGESAGGHMYRAYTSGEDGSRGPVSRAWWAITREVRRLKGDLAGPPSTWEELHGLWESRLQATSETLRHARLAQQAGDDPDIDWLVRCLQVGEGFARVVMLSMALRLEASPDATDRLREALDELEGHINSSFDLRPVDILGGDPGCWHDTIGALRELAGHG